MSGVSSGTANISYIVSNACGTHTSFYAVSVNPLPVAGPISGPAGMCNGASITLTSTVSGGTWSNGGSSVATVNASGASSAIVNGLSTGTAIITYTITNTCGTVNSFHTVAVDPILSAGTVTGSNTACAGTSVTLASSGSTGGTWKTTTGTVATVGASSGIVTGLTAGTAIISYVVRNTCNADSAGYTITFSPAPSPGTISGPSAVCTGSTISLTSSGTAGGTWTSSFIPFATISSGGVVTGVSAGTTVISYSVTNGCGTASTGHTVTVNTIPSAGTITGSSTVCAGSSISLTDGVSGGTWTSGSTAFATVTTGGVVGVLLPALH